MAAAGTGPESSSRTYHVVAFSGSLRKASCNAGLLRAIVEQVDGMSDLPLKVTVLDIKDFPVLNMDELPDVVKAAHEVAHSADAFIIVTPEYNYGVAAPTKNAIDWLSKPLLEGKTQHPLFNKPVAIMSAGGGLGGFRAQYHLRQTFAFLNMHDMKKPEVGVRIFNDPKPFDMATGDLTGPGADHVKGNIDRWLAAFAEWIPKFASSPEA